MDLAGEHNSKHIKWDIVENEYCGFEIKNYSKIKKELLKEIGLDGMGEYLWFFSFDFSSGCIWDMKAVKEIKYFGEIG